MRVTCAFFSHSGPRSTNQDRVLVPGENDAPFLVAAIADGIGGAPGGEQAAVLAIEAASHAGPDPDQLSNIFSEVVNAFRERAAVEPDFDRMGTTLSIALLVDWTVHVAHVGDTRIYHLRGRGLNNLTEDQTEVAALIRKGILRKGQERRYGRRNVLLSALSPKGDYEVYRSSAHLEIGDRLLLLTDGVYHRVPRGRVLDASLSHKRVDHFVEALQHLAIDGLPSDNFTALCLQMSE